MLDIDGDSCHHAHNAYKQFYKQFNNEVSHLLDIDGDSCHHAHNAYKQFYKQFNNEVEQLLRYIFTDFKSSADLREILEEMCLLLKVKYMAFSLQCCHRYPPPHRCIYHILLWILEFRLTTSVCCTYPGYR